jgi:cardiolipin synthase
VRFTGPAVAEGQQAFAENWVEAGGGLLPPDAFPPAESSGPSLAAFVASAASPVGTRAERLVQLLVLAASKRLWIANAYFVPTRAIVDMLERKAAAGVDVRVLVAGKQTDVKPALPLQRMKSDDLVAHGVRVFEYDPTMMHAKTMVVDDELALIGSINLEPLSLTKLEEGALVVHDRAVAATLADAFEKDCARAHAVAR